MELVPIIYHPFFAHHLTGIGHPECPQRCEVIVNALSKQGLLTKENMFTPLLASLDEVLLCHDKSYVEIVQNNVAIAKRSQAINGEYTLSTGDVQICPDSLDVALFACGAALKAVEIVMEGFFKTAFCPIRPPGHHATTNQGMGFCIFNNVAIAARYAMKKYGLKRILIADWDLHHGNGTQEIFFSDSRVFYFSTHQSGIYPGTGFADERGYGNILNCPIAGGTGSRLNVLKAFQKQLIPAMHKFHPELVFISAGFDAHVDDPLGNLDLTTDDFRELTEILQGIALQHCEGRLISLLEGGYNLNALAECAVAHVKALSRG